MKAQRRPRVSLRTHLILWFVGFSVVPLFFMMGVSISAYKDGISKELAKRLTGNVREVRIILEDFENVLSAKTRERIKDSSLIYYLTQGQTHQARSVAHSWLASSLADRLSIFNRDGRMEIALYKDDEGNIQRNEKYEATDFYLTDKFLERAREVDIQKIIDFNDKKYFDLISFAAVKSQSSRTVGYIEEIIRLDELFFDGIKKRLNIELVFFSQDGERVVASHDDLENYPKGFFLKQKNENQDDLFDLNIREEPYGFVIRPLSWGEQTFYVALGASKRGVNTVLRDVSYAFFSFVLITLIFLAIFSVIISRMLVRPVTDLVEAIQVVDLNGDAEPIQVKRRSASELGILADAFNEMFARVHGAQRELRDKIRELETANQEIRETQAKLVHAAKMASLGQLVAGIAHELNNPIGFIYSNMAHLRDYSQKLIGLVRKAEKVADLEREKADAEFDYIVEDMPKLISSCEDGARRTRDIVVGLRNFSRLEDAVVKEVDLAENLDNTLNLLRGETKNRIEIVKDYQSVPHIKCYPSQLNQVLMNILSNAAQAIEGEGQIRVALKPSDVEGFVDVVITDSGKGMDEETLAKIFDPFFTTKGIGAGTGLGLSISYGIVHKHGGEILVRSKPGQGTEFTLRLPLKSPLE